MAATTTNDVVDQPRVPMEEEGGVVYFDASANINASQGVAEMNWSVAPLAASQHELSEYHLDNGTILPAQTDIVHSLDAPASLSDEAERVKLRMELAEEREMRVSDRSKLVMLGSSVASLLQNMQQALLSVSDAFAELGVAVALPLDGSHYNAVSTARRHEIMSSSSNGKSRSAGLNRGPRARRPRARKILSLEHHHSDAQNHQFSENGGTDLDEIGGIRTMGSATQGSEVTIVQQGGTIPRTKITARPASKKMRMLYFGRSFLLFAVQHFEKITTGWSRQKYPQGRPSKERSYASVLSVLTFFARYDPEQFENYLNVASTITDRDRADLVYNNWASDVDANGRPTISPFLKKSSDYVMSDADIRPLRPNQLQFQPYANLYIACFGAIQDMDDGSRDFVLYRTPKEFSPELVAMLASANDSNASLSEHRDMDTFSSPNNMNAPCESEFSTATYDGYATADIDRYVQSHNRRPAVELHSDHDMSLGSLGIEMMEGLKENEDIPSSRQNRRRKQLVYLDEETGDNPAALASALGINTKSSKGQGKNKKRKRPDQEEAAASVAGENEAQITSHTDMQCDESATRSSTLPSQGELESNVDEAAPVPKRARTRARIMNADGSYTVVALPVGSGVYHNKILPLSEIQRIKSQSKSADVSPNGTADLVSNEEASSAAATATTTTNIDQTTKETMEEHTSVQLPSPSIQKSTTRSKSSRSNKGYKPVPRQSEVDDH